jgi:phosphatidylinositol alpha-mannosyltransferase
MHPAPIVGTFHAAGESAGYRYLRRLIRAEAPNISHAVAVSPDAAELVRRYIGGDYEILYNGVELDVYRDSPAHPTEAPTIFFCARHEQRKGLDVLLQAMSELGPDVRLWIAGSGPDTVQLQNRYADDHRITWLGRLSDADKIARLRGAHVFCAPSLHGESFGVVLIEAMAANTPIVASSLDGYRNVATDGVDALLVEPGDPSALAAALRRVLTDDELSAKLRDAGSRRADDFSMTTLARHYAEHYHRLAANRPRRSRATTRESFWGSWRRRMLAE